LGCDAIHHQLLEENNKAKSLKEILAVLDEIGGRVREEQADMGIVVDNNAERLILLDEKGQLIQDEQFVALIAFLVLKYTEHSTVAVPVTASGIIEELSKEYRGKVVRTKANPRSLMEKVAEEKIFAGRDGKTQFQPAFDALLSLVKILELVAREGMTLSELVATLPRFYMEHREVACPWEEKGRIMRALFEENKDRPIEAVDGLKVFHDNGWALVLPDAEEPVFQIYSEGTSPEQAGELARLYMERINELQMK
jgi:mannose-1-phosphate guanylyltransferase/phosphomannomutase